MSVAARLLREPALITGVVVAGLGVAVLFDAPLTEAQVGGLVTFFGAVVALLRFVVTPAEEVVAQRRPDGEVVAGRAAPVNDGTPVTLHYDTRGEVGAVDTRALAIFAIALALVALLLIIL